MNKTTERSPLGERTKMLISAGVTGALLLLALLLPLAFRTSSAPPEPAAGERAGEARAQLFAAWWFPEEGAEGPETEKLDAPGEATIRFCGERMRTLVAACLPDEGFTYDAPTGSEYTLLRGEETEVRVCRMWLQVQGDWQNWLDVCFDADSGAVYYLYASRALLRNDDRYGADARPGAEGVAAALAEDLGGTLRLFTPAEGGGSAVITAGEDTLCYRIDCVSYDRLVDLKLRCF